MIKNLIVTTVICTLAMSVHCQNLVNSDSWTVGSGSIGIFSQNGVASENVRELGLGPHGDEAILWKAVPNAEGNASGGWDTQNFSIDHTKMYRFSVWIKKTNSNDGTTYFGCRANDILTLSGSVHSNPYFWNGDLPALNKWYLLVGYVHASDDPSTTNYGGIYDGETGAKVWTITDFKFSSSATHANHRAYLYYDVNTSNRQYFFGPEVFQLDSKSPINEHHAPALFNANAYFSKRAGVGTLDPLGVLHLHSSATELYLTSDSWAGIRGNNQTWLFGYGGDPGSEDISIGTQDNSGSRTVTLAAGGAARMKILSDGNVGIGTTTPSERLTVNGTIYGKEVKVDLSVPGPDYVFDAEYELPPLDTIQKYISANKHLPGIPSAKEMEANGINVGEMNMLLLQKVEELTLYLIELKNENVQMKADINTLKQNK